MEQTEQTSGRRLSDRIEQRTVSTLRDLDGLGLRPSVVLLVVICVGITIAIGFWFYIDQRDQRAFRTQQFNQQIQYGHRMLEMVSAIQAELKQKNELYAKDRIENARTFRDIIDRLSRLEAIYMDMGILPVYKDEKTGRTYIQRQQGNGDLYE